MTLRQIGAVVVCALVCALSVSAAEARPRNVSHCVSDNLGREVCSGPAGNHVGDVTRMVERAGAIIVGGRPDGCPRRYCGCAVSLKVFGRMVEGLNLAANWKHRFPHAEPGPGMVAARSGHVFYIKRMIDGDTALAWDPNSGKGKIRIHERSLRGYTVVDPNGSRVALR